VCGKVEIFRYKTVEKIPNQMNIIYMNVSIDMFHLIHQILTDGWVTPGMLMKQNGKNRYYERQVQFIMDYPISYHLAVFEGSQESWQKIVGRYLSISSSCKKAISLTPITPHALTTQYTINYIIFLFNLIYSIYWLFITLSFNLN